MSLGAIISPTRKFRGACAFPQGAFAPLGKILENAPSQVNLEAPKCTASLRKDLSARAVRYSAEYGETKQQDMKRIA